MKPIEEYFEPGDKNDRMIQKVLREVDLDTVIYLCAKLGEKSEMIIRNLSRAVAREVQDELSGERFIPEARMNRSYALFQKKLMRFEFYKRDSATEINNLAFTNANEIKNSLQKIFQLDRDNKIEDLSSLIEGIEDETIKEQLRTILFADDPLKAEEKILKIQKRWFSKEKQKMELLKDGIISILSGESRELLIERIDG